MRVHARFSVVFRAFKKRQRGEILLKVALLIFVLLQTHLFIRYFDCDCGLRIYFLCVCSTLLFPISIWTIVSLFLALVLLFYLDFVFLLCLEFLFTFSFLFHSFYIPINSFGLQSNSEFLPKMLKFV